MKPQHDLDAGRSAGRVRLRGLPTPTTATAAAWTAESVEAARLAGLTPAETRKALDAVRGITAPTNVIDPTATVHPTATVWHYAVVLQQVVIHEGVSIGSHCEIGRGSRIGARSRIGNGCFLPPNTEVGERVFIGPHVVMCDDRHPRVPVPGIPSYFAEPPVIADDAVIGAGAVILPGVRIGRNARVAAGALVTRDVPDGGCVKSAPAREYALSGTASGKW